MLNLVTIKFKNTTVDRESQTSTPKMCLKNSLFPITHVAQTKENLFRHLSFLSHLILGLYYRIKNKTVLNQDYPYEKLQNLSQNRKIIF